MIAFIGAWALTPWNILSSASALLNFMDGYIIWVIYPISNILVRETRLLTFLACSHHRHLTSRLLDCAQASLRRRSYVRSKRLLPLQQIWHKLAGCSGMVRCLDPAHARFRQRSMFPPARRNCREFLMLMFRRSTPLWTSLSEQGILLVLATYMDSL